jgi:hypothetical protein
MMPPALLLDGRHVDEPHEKEEGHHGRHEVGIGDLPGAAMVGMAGLLDLLDDDGLIEIGHACRASVAGYLVADGRAAVAASTSL